jgi:Capsule polysaccharide biosynthesis protein
MKRVLILSPRLDVMFKEGPVPSKRGPIPAIRVHWANFVKCVEAEHKNRGDEVTVLELPLWQFKPELVKDTDIVYVPHREKRSFPVAESIEARYYMQTVFPWRFYVDSLGWAGGASIYPAIDFVTKTPSNPYCYEELRQYALRNGSKFDQPPVQNIKLPEDFVFFPCQIPHDETIKYHSNVSVETALEATLSMCWVMNKKVIVKGHPVNPGSMAPLKSICAKYENAIWLENVSIHEIIPKARVIVVVNSGTGMETLLHSKPVITFGRCEYDVVTMNASGMEELKTMITLPRFNLDEVKRFFNNWCEWTFDTLTPSDFNKLA